MSALLTLGVLVERLWFRHGVSWTAAGLAVTLALVFGLALGCSQDPGSSSGANPAGSGPTDFPNPLMSVLTKLVTKDIPAETYLAVKYSLLSNALANLDFKKAGHTSISELSNKQDYVQSKGNQPGFFAKPFADNNVDVKQADGDGGRYDYLKDGETWLDYAAVNLGGGVFHNGFGQEETMALEMPELANAAAQGGHFTRGQGCKDNDKPRPLECSPAPLYVGPVHRTMKVASGINEPNGKWKSMPIDALLTYMTPLPRNVELNVLAVALASLEGTTGQEAEQPTIDDMFNTLAAGFKLAKDNKVTTLNTGPIGTGIFKNSTKVVYVMQKLAAMQVGINLRYYGLSKADQSTWDPIVDHIVADYKGGSHTVKRLLELAHDSLK
ncbi:hypothetical protein [Mycobacterium numidiamassiliense]|uniref:hypothetical protein n=1 Tax=Mycobacterium numidiamassiliense TaxID=1841861 RepID=UPI00105586C4|nr:hypothetical protein [Mycobacterium numidiamassiliense]